MKVISQYGYVFFILIGIMSMQACNNQPAKGQGQASNTSSSISTNVPPPSVYASDKEGWLDNLKEAQAQSVKEHKPILASFTASDTCGLCERMDADVFSTPVFKAWAQKTSCYWT